MKILKSLAIAAMALFLAAPSHAASLTSGNGLTAGAALLNLYTQYKADGKLDLANANNISNIMTLASNIKGLDQLKNKSSFLTGLISGSKNLVNKSNSSSVLSSLTKLSGLDLSSLGSSSSSDAASAVTGVLSKVASSAATKSSGNSSSSASSAASILTGLFKNL